MANLRGDASLDDEGEEEEDYNIEDETAPRERAGGGDGGGGGGVENGPRGSKKRKSSTTFSSSSSGRRQLLPQYTTPLEEEEESEGDNDTHTSGTLREQIEAVQPSNHSMLSQHPASIVQRQVVAKNKGYLRPLEALLEKQPLLASVIGREARRGKLSSHWYLASLLLGASIVFPPDTVTYSCPRDEGKGYPVGCMNLLVLVSVEVGVPILGKDSWVFNIEILSGFGITIYTYPHTHTPQQSGGLYVVLCSTMASNKSAMGEDLRDGVELAQDSVLEAYELGEGEGEVDAALRKMHILVASGISTNLALMDDIEKHRSVLLAPDESSSIIELMRARPTQANAGGNLRILILSADSHKDLTHRAMGRGRA